MRWRIYRALYERDAAHRVMTLTGSNGGTPLEGHREYIADDGVHRVFSMVDDGGFVGIGYPDQWHVIMRTKAARMFALWTLRVWLADWCGLRSAIYYRALGRATGGSWQRPGSPRRVRALTARSSYDEWRESGERA